MSLFLFNGFSSNSSSVFTTNRIQSIRVNPISASLIPARDRPIDFGKHKGRPLGTLPSKYLKWVSKNLRARDFEDWAKLADEVLEDPVYKDRLEWELAEQILSGDSGAGRGGESPVSNLVELSERFGWDNEDEFGWSRVDFELLGTSKGGRIPRRRGGSKGTQNEKLEPLRGKIGFFNKSRSGVGGEEKRVVSVGGKREERIERQKLRRSGVSKVGLGIGGKNEEIVVNQDEVQLIDQEEMMKKKKKPLNKFPGRESLLRKALNRREDNLADQTFGKLPDHLLIEIFIRVPISDWAEVSCVKKQWASIFQSECLWKSALIKTWPSADQGKQWPGPIPRGLSRRRYAAFYVSKHILTFVGEIDEIVGHSYLFLKEQLERSAIPPPSGILHGTIIDQFIACGKSRDKAHELASQIWLAVIDNLEENEHTFLLLKHLVQEADIFLPYPYSRSFKVQWRVFEKLFTDFRDCFNWVDYYDVLACAKYKFQHIPETWLGH